MYLLFVPPLEFVFVSNFILSVYLCLCTIFVYSAILGKPYKSTVISNNNTVEPHYKDTLGPDNLSTVERLSEVENVLAL